MVTAVIAAPVPPPTIAAMPMIAKVGTLTPSIGWIAVMKAPNAPPMVAPMNSDGEKIPPDDPEPRLVEVAQQLCDKQQKKQRRQAKAAEQNPLDRRVTDAFDIIMPGESEQQVDQDTQSNMPTM